MESDGQSFQSTHKHAHRKKLFTVGRKLIASRQNHILFDIFLLFFKRSSHFVSFFFYFLLLLIPSAISFNSLFLFRTIQFSSCNTRWSMRFSTDAHCIYASWNDRIFIWCDLDEGNHLIFDIFYCHHVNWAELFIFIHFDEEKNTNELNLYCIFGCDELLNKQTTNHFVAMKTKTIFGFCWSRAKFFPSQSWIERECVLWFGSKAMERNKWKRWNEKRK